MSVDVCSSSSLEFAPHVSISYPIRLISLLRSAIWVTFIQDNPLTWWWQQGRRNERADYEGPLYVYGAPSRQIESGKAALATVVEMKQFTPFLLQMIIRSPKGDPLPNAKVDFWQATTDGLYAYRSYALRGRFTTDANGNVEVLTVIPGDYGAAGNLRTGHFHIMMQDAEGQCERLTTQLYVCRGNNLDAMKNDFLNYVRALRPQNMLRSWSIPTNNDGKAHFDLPELPPDDVSTLKRVEWWNAKLAEHAPDSGLKVVAGGQTEFRLNDKPGLLGF